MGKYDPLETHLSEQADDSCALTFFGVEDILGDSLPASARRYGSWWGNDETHTQARSWMRAGWKVERFSLEEKRVCFSRDDRLVRRPAERSLEGARSQVIVRNLDAETVAALKWKAKRRGCSLERMLRTILTQAARPGRAELVAEADRIRAMTAGPLEDSVSLLRRDRDDR